MILNGAPAACIADFDGTITRLDVVDSLLARFAKGPEWEIAEREWAGGRISSSECLKRQLACVKITRDELNRFVDAVAVDPGFVPLVRLLRREGVPLLVLSDGFDLFIGRVLERLGLEDVPFRSNRLRWESGRLIPSFPYKKDSCGRCAHCKRSSIVSARPLGHLIFVGDGLSDICAADACHTVFAKSKLAAHCREAGRSYVPYDGLKDVAAALPALLNRIRENMDERNERNTVKSR